MLVDVIYLGPLSEIEFPGYGIIKRDSTTPMEKETAEAICARNPKSWKLAVKKKPKKETVEDE